MAKQFSTISLFLLCLLAFQEVMPSEASICSAPSKLFRRLCFRSNNCSAVCKKEGFSYGLCKHHKCVCRKNCNSGGGGNGGDQGQRPPNDGGGNGDDGGDQGQGPPEQGGGDQQSALNRKYLIEA